MKLRPYVLFAQVAFGLIGGFFFILGAVGTLTYRPSPTLYGSTGASPVIGIFIGLPLIAVAGLLTELHTKTNKNQKILVRCPNCNFLNEDKIKFCGECGTDLQK